MKRPRFNLDDSWLAITLGFVTAALISGFFTSPPLSELKQWAWGAVLGHIVGLIMVAMLGCSLSFGIAEHLMKDQSETPIARSRVASYTLCLLVLLAFSVLLGSVWSSSLEPGDEIDGTGRVATVYVRKKSLAERDALIEKIFLSFLAPALLGVRAALGPKLRPKGV